jgi:hypothetical protein
MKMFFDTISFWIMITRGRKVLAQNVFSFLTRLKGFPTSQNLCNLWQAQKIRLEGHFFHTFLYFYFCDPKLKVGTFVVIPACRANLP